MSFPTEGFRWCRFAPLGRLIPVLTVVLLLVALDAPAAAADDPTPEEVFGTFINILGQAAQSGNQPPAAPAAVPAGYNLSTDVYLKNNAGQYVRIANPVRGRMVEGDHSFSDGCVGDYLYYDGAANEKLIVTLTSANLDTLLYVLDLNGNTLGMDDDAGGDYNSRLEVTLPAEGFYQILVTTTDPNMERRPNRDVYGEYELTVLSDYPGYRPGATNRQDPTGDYSPPPPTSPPPAPSTPAPPAAPPTPAAAPSVADAIVAGAALLGQDGEWDFTADRSSPAGEETVRCRYTAERREETRDGTLEVTVTGRHLKAVLLDSGGNPLRYYDGLIAADGSVVTGAAADAADWPGQRAPWWATIETGRSPEPGGRLELNSVSVLALEAAGFTPAGARTVVGGRVLGGAYRNVQEALAAPGLNTTEKRLLQERSYVR